MSRSQHQQMRDAINDVELALNGLEIDDIVHLFQNADDSVMVKVPLGALRQLGRCYPSLNRIINDPAFERATPSVSQGVRDMRAEANQREMAEGTRCDGSCNDGLPCHCGPLRPSPSVSRPNPRSEAK